MKFHLYYEGSLRANGSPEHKDELRRAFHAQLEVLWREVPLSSHTTWLDPGHKESLIQSLGGVSFAPLICSRLSLVCELDVVMLRPEAPGGLIASGGDIDNRLKTLFDALRMPRHTNELVVHGGLYFCLLEDDNLIVRVNMATDRLLKPAGKDHVVLMIAVAATPVRYTVANLSLAWASQWSGRNGSSERRGRSLTA